MKLNASKSKTMTVSRSRTSIPAHPDLHVGGVNHVNSATLDILGVTFDQKLTFESHICSMVSRASRSLGIFRKASRVFGDHTVSLRCFRSFVLPLLEYCSPVWDSACETHISLLDRIVGRAQFLCGGEGVGDLSHRRRVGWLCMMHKVWTDPAHPLHEHLPASLVPVRVTRGTVALHGNAFVVARCRTEQYMRSFISVGVRLWNSLPSSVFLGGSLSS